jgi:membrane fusion protein (multidrug efflux system)
VSSRRKPALLLLTAALLLAAAGGGWWWLTQRHVERTDNAYVQAPVVQITPQVAAPCWRCWSTTPTVVKRRPAAGAAGPGRREAGAGERAEAQLAQTVREVRALWPTTPR